MTLDLGFLHPTYPASEGTGASHSATRIVAEVAARGHDVTVYCRETPGDDATAPAGATLRSLDRSGYPYHTGQQFDRALRDVRADLAAHDVVHSYVMNALPVLGDLARETDTATVLTLNAYGAVCPKNDLRYMDREPCTSNGLAKCTACALATSPGHDEYGAPYRAASRLGYLDLVRRGERVADAVDAYHALSGHIEATYGEFGFPTERFAVVPNLLDERFDRPHESGFEPPYDLLYVGSLDEHKGVDRLVPALARLNADSDDDYRLTVVGDGGLRSDVEARAADAGLADAVTCTGWMANDDLPGVFARHDCFLYPGRWDEPFGRVFLEALGTGTPVVATDVGSVADIVGAGGRVVEGGVDALAAGVRDLADDGFERASRAARERVDDYRPATVVPQFIALYERARERARRW
ncbi:glycosyltransferase family 4 protein [Halarchaeum nitratireducens]|uniref:Glycosyl transferase family 1 n=1 Tax=Halarchaeum nitratireducens TaxID=489913 RepID=A0A830GA36_9EURY|nr:glycosyltransferase family 4 protein [Halarchaeum nitratireducens]GGN09856.1 glycosyl transferase family 1 [Halarchaeum nitratireducens]